MVDLVALEDELLFYQLGGQPVRCAEIQTEQLTVQPFHRAADGAVAVLFFGDAGTVLGFLAGPCLAAQHSGHSALPHTAGQVVGKLLRHFAALLGDGIAALCQGDELLSGDIVQTRADLEIVHQRFFHQGVFDLLPGNGSGIFDQIAQQQPDLGAAGQPAGTYTGSKSIIGGHRSIHPPCIPFLL